MKEVVVYVERGEGDALERVETLTYAWPDGVVETVFLDPPTLNEGDSILVVWVER